jgi:hypothetical protein
MTTMKHQVSGKPAHKPVSDDKLKSGLPGSAAERDRGLQAAIKRHAETLRRLAR